MCDHLIDILVDKADPFTPLEQILPVVHRWYSLPSALCRRSLWLNFYNQASEHINREQGCERWHTLSIPSWCFRAQKWMAFQPQIWKLSWQQGKGSRQNLDVVCFRSNDLDFPGDSHGKESACNVGDVGWSLEWKDSLEKELATLSSVLAWRIPGSEEPGRLQSLGSQRVGRDQETKTHTHTYTHTPHQ